MYASGFLGTSSVLTGMSAFRPKADIADRVVADRVVDDRVIDDRL
jgi:hypothetical protein